MSRASKFFLLYSVLSLLVLQSGCSHTTAPAPLSDKFHDIQTRTLNVYCAYSGCHGGDQPAALLSLDSTQSYANLLGGHVIQNEMADTIYKALVVPNKPDSSFLYIKLTNPTTDEGARMPNRGDQLPQDQIDAIKSWILRGAPND